MAVWRLRYSEFRVAVAAGRGRAALGWTDEGVRPYTTLDGAKPRHHTRRLTSPRHRNHRDPLAVPLFAIGNRAAKTLGDIFGQQVAVVAEELLFDTLPRIPIFQERVRWLVLGGEDQGHVELAAGLGCCFDLCTGEILDAQDLERLTGVGVPIAEPRPGEFVRRRPRGQNALAGISHRKEAAGFRVHHDVIAIREIVFERESIQRIAETAG